MWPDLPITWIAAAPWSVKDSGHQAVSFSGHSPLPRFPVVLGTEDAHVRRFHVSLLADVDNLFRLKHHVSFCGQIRIPIGFSAV